MTTCLRCGHTFTASVPQPMSCNHCDPQPCVDCGDPDDRSCPCWVAIEGMAHADIKALFAREGLSVERTSA